MPAIPPSTLKRNEFGLIEDVDYAFHPNGFVDWRAMIPEEFLYPNKGWFESRNQPVPDSIEGLEDHQLVIKLGGIKELARLRGFTNVHQTISVHNSQHVTAECSIHWIPNYETNNLPVSFESVANATVDNCSGFGAKFLESIAENRAFVRAVRNFLNIHIVGEDEIDKSKNAPSSTPEEESGGLPNLNNKVRIVLKEKGLKTQDDFTNLLSGLISARKIDRSLDEMKNAEGKILVGNLTNKECRIILGALKNN